MMNKKLDKLFLIKENPDTKVALDFMDWKAISKEKDLSEVFIYNFHEYLDMHYVCKYSNISETFITNNYNKIDFDWKVISEYQRLSVEFIRKFSDKLDYDKILYNVFVRNKLYEALFDEDSQYPYMPDDSLSENFMIKFKDDVDWEYVCQNQQLSEELMRECDSYLYWDEVSIFQDMSIEFMRDYRDRLNLKLIEVANKHCADKLKQMNLNDNGEIL